MHVIALTISAIVIKEVLMLNLYEVAMYSLHRIFLCLFIFSTSCTHLKKQPNAFEPNNPSQTRTIANTDFAPLFSESQPITLTLTAPFSQLKKLITSAGDQAQGDGDNPAAWAQGSLIYQDRHFEVKVRARGRTSIYLDDVDFPKLRVEVSKQENLSDTIFSGSAKMRVNTHLNNHPQSEYTKQGRLNGEKPVYREALAYEIANSLGLAIPGIRRATINYIEQEQKLTRKALIVEANKSMSKRFQAKEVDEFEFSQQEKTRLEPTTAALFFLFHAMIGNEDVKLRVYEEPKPQTDFYRPIDNTFIFEKNKIEFPVVYDLDLGSIITSLKPLNESAWKIPEFGLMTGLEGRLAYLLAALRGKLGLSEITEALQIIKSRTPQTKKVISDSLVDEEGRKLAQDHIAAFQKVAPRWLNWPIIVKKGIHFYESPTGKTLTKTDPITEEPCHLRIGTPVQIIEERGNWVKVAIIDFKMELQNSTQYIGWIEKEGIGEEVPQYLLGIVEPRDLMSM